MIHYFMIKNFFVLVHFLCVDNKFVVDLLYLNFRLLHNIVCIPCRMQSVSLLLYRIKRWSQSYSWLEWKSFWSWLRRLEKQRIQEIPLQCRLTAHPMAVHCHKKGSVSLLHNSVWITVVFFTSLLHIDYWMVYLLEGGRCACYNKIFDF